jgi:hypothetical protein
MRVEVRGTQDAAVDKAIALASIVTISTVRLNTEPSTLGSMSEYGPAAGLNPTISA